MVKSEVRLKGVHRAKCACMHIPRRRLSKFDAICICTCVGGVHIKQCGRVDLSHN